MEKNESLDVKDVVHKLQLDLLEGIRDETQLFAAGSAMSQSDYIDVVTERSIANLCGYPLCRNYLPSERSRKGRYRISLKEHKVYDLHEAYLYCSTDCVVNSRSFAASLPKERCSTLNPAKLNEVLKLFERLSLDSKEDLVKNEDLGLSELKIEEKTDTKAAQIPLEEWVGPSNAIEGYVPQRDCKMQSSKSKNHKEGLKSKPAQLHKEKGGIFNEFDFTSCIITQDEYSISKISSGPVMPAPNKESKVAKVRVKKTEDQLDLLEKPAAPDQSSSEDRESYEENSPTVTSNNLSISELSSIPYQNGAKVNANEVGEEILYGRAAELSSSMLKPSLKSSGAKKVPRTVTWADEIIDKGTSQNLCEVKEIEDKASERLEVDERFASAEACARALNQAAEAVVSGEIDVPDAVSEAGIIILPPPHDVDEAESQEDVDVLDAEPAPLKWPRKPGFPNYDLFESEDSWHDSPPEGFSLTLSPFATMYMALFSWVSSSSLAYVYGRDESFHEDYLSINGREYPEKIVLTDGRSSEIKQTLAGCLTRALPGLVTDLRLPTPVSSLEQQLGRLLDTMSFTDPLPPFRMKQWQVVVLLFLDALSVSRIPALTSQMMNRRLICHKVLDGAQVSAEEYEVMKDLLIPLGRVPEFSTQSGG